MEKNPAARARVEETRAGYEVELRNLTGETAAVLSPEEQARADAIRQEQQTPPAVLPPGQGFGLVGAPQDFSQAEAAAVEVAGIPAMDEAAPAQPMTAEDSQALDRSQLKSEADLIRDYQAQALDVCLRVGAQVGKPGNIAAGRVNFKPVDLQKVSRH